MAWWGKKNSQPARRQPRYMTGQDNASFRRSRTLSDRVPTEQQKEQSARLQEHARARRRHIIRIVMIIAIVGGILFYWLLTQYALTVRSVSFAPLPTKAPQEQRYKDVISDYLYKYPVERFRFILNEKRFSEYLGKKLPEVSTAKSSGGGIGYGDYTVALREPLVGWQVGERQYLVDKNGVSFNQNYFNAPSVNVVDQSGVKIEDGGVIASNRFLSFLGRIVSLVNESGVGQVEKIVIPAGVTRQVDVYLKGSAYPIKTNVDRDPAQQVEDMKKVLGFLKQRGITPRHVDVRVSGRVFYL